MEYADFIFGDERNCHSLQYESVFKIPLKYQDNRIPFPVLRLGNREKMHNGYRFIIEVSSGATIELYEDEIEFD